MVESDLFDVTGRCFVIVGGTAGLGQSAALSLVKSGARVVVVGRSKENLETTLNLLGESGAGIAGDASDSETAVRAVDLAVERFGSLSGLYHVAGGSGRSKGDGPVHEMTDEGWEYTVGVNLSSVIFSNRAAVRQFLKQGGGGVILNMGSVLGASPSTEFFASHAYAATKAGIAGFSKSAAAYYAPDDIRINVIAPALVETPMSGRAVTDDRIMAFVKTKQPLGGGRIGMPDDYDGAVRFLLSDASRFMTGQVVTVDGGWSVSEGQIPKRP